MQREMLYAQVRPALATFAGLFVLALQLVLADTFFGARSLLNGLYFGSRRLLVMQVLEEAVGYLLCFGVPCLILVTVFRRLMMSRSPLLAWATAVLALLLGGSGLLLLGLPASLVAIAAISLVVALGVATWR
jgi:hypothetical protein